MRAVIAAVLVLALAAPASAQSLKLGAAVLITGQAADTVTTCAGLGRGLAEANPLLPSSCRGIAGVKTSITVALVIAAHRAVKQGAPERRVSRVLIVVGLIGYAAAGWNTHQMAKARR